MNALPEFPQYVKSPYNPDLVPEGIDAEIAVHNGEILFEFMRKYMNNQFDDIAPGFLATNVYPQEKAELVLSYFDDPKRKEWLGRQYYLILGVNRPLEDVMFDDGPMFFNWLLRREGPTINGLPESPLLFADGELIVQAGGRRGRHGRHGRLSRKRSTRRRASRKRKSLRKRG